jgi:uncharacterized Ntn-hydrolase superfamily protein
MRRAAVAAAAIVMAWQAGAHATWSVIALDRQSKAIVIASATCVPQEAFEKFFKMKDLRDVQAIVVPGKGVAAAQAGADRTRANQNLIFQELQKGTDPARILDLLKADPAIEVRQFGILDMQGRAAGFSGAKNQAVSLDRHARVPGTDIYYSIQGNILASEAVVTGAMDAFANASGELTDRVMAAMEAADARGGDKRCTCDTPPTVDAPCDGKTAHVAYILLSNPSDPVGPARDDVVYSMYIRVTDRDIAPTENANPVKTLRIRYDGWKRQRSAFGRLPNP